MLGEVGAGWDGLRSGAGYRCAGREWAKFLKFMRGGFKFCGYGAGADKRIQPAQDSASYDAAPQPYLAIM